MEKGLYIIDNDIRFMEQGKVFIFDLGGKELIEMIQDGVKMFLNGRIIEEKNVILKDYIFYFGYCYEVIE